MDTSDKSHTAKVKIWDSSKVKIDETKREDSVAGVKTSSPPFSFKISSKDKAKLKRITPKDTRGKF